MYFHYLSSNIFNLNVCVHHVDEIKDKIWHIYQLFEVYRVMDIFYTIQVYLYFKE